MAGEAPEDDEPSTVLRTTFDPTPLAQSRFHLEVIEGPDTGLAFTLDSDSPGRSLLGKSPSCDVRLSDPAVSRRHAALEIAGTRLRISDLGSSNGTAVDGLHVVEAFLVGRELLRVGRSTIRVERDDTARPPPPRPPALTHFGRVVGASTEMRRLYALAARLAASDVSVVIEGQTGTGKEQLAEALHEEGPRASGPFVVFDCTAVPPSLVESELFGHERGAFTGAVSARKGVFEQAHGGTLLIDEIGDLDISLQPKLLRAIERAEVRRVGGDRAIKVDVRLLAATRRDLDHEVQAGRFRDDLFHRIAVTRIELPPLRTRRGDVGVLARHFWRQLGEETPLPEDLVLRLEQQEWPGNVRELRNAVARHRALGDLLQTAPSAGEDPADGHPVSTDFLERILALNLPIIQARQQMIEEFEQRYIERVLASHDGNVAKAAAASGIARRHFQRLKARATR
jgi:DNA-binding NtrC family response regulator